MPRKRKWVDPDIQNATEYVEELRADLREMKNERAEADAGLKVVFTKDIRKMRADYVGQIRKLNAEILQYQYEAGRTGSHDEGASAARRKLQELKGRLRIVKREYSQEKLARKSELAKRLNTLRTEDMAVRNQIELAIEKNLR